MSQEKAGIAFRPSTVSPSEILKLSKIIDQSPISNIFVNDSSHAFDCLDICSSVLGVTKGVSVGSGVVRVLEHDPKQLIKRVATLQEISSGRFVLGVGTGSPGSNPGARIGQMVEVLQSLRSSYPAEVNYSFPKTLIATLNPGIVRKVAGKSDGILLNFCSPRYAEGLVGVHRELVARGAEFACYLKVFYSESPTAASELLLKEFKSYARIEQYRKMFEGGGVLADIEGADHDIPDSLFEISLTNPSSAQLRDHVSRFRNSNITLPCVYPYFAPEDKFEFKIETVRSIINAIT